MLTLTIFHAIIVGVRRLALRETVEFHRIEVLLKVFEHDILILGFGKSH